MTFFTAFIEYCSSLTTFLGMILSTFLAGRVRSITLLGYLLASIYVRLIVLFSLVITLVRSLRLNTLLALIPFTTVLISTLIILFLPVLEQALPHFLS